MKTIFKHFLATAVLLLGSVNMNAEVYSGDCGAQGNNVKWELDAETGLLSITGIGNMKNYSVFNQSPWYLYCSSIIKVIMKDGVTSIGEHAFHNCSGLTSINIPNSVTTIGGSAFSFCSGLTSVNIPEGVTSIGSSAFYGCSGLTSITIPEGVTSIGERAFYNCSGLTSINIPEGVTSIGNGAFENCTGLTSITIPEGVTSIGNLTFESCSGLTSITIPSSVTSIGWGAFRNCSGLASINIPGCVTSVGEKVFSGCSGLISVIISESVTTIGDNAFEGCSSLTSITIPEGLTSIGREAFMSCSSLTSITFPSSVTWIGVGAFSGCSGLTSINIPEGVTGIWSKTFYDCSGLTSVNIPSSVTTIGDCAFLRCSGLTSITVPQSVTSIGNGAFENCTGLTSITIPEGVTTIGDYAFHGCSSLTSITIPEGVTSIGREAFMRCSGLTSITIPESVTSIGGGVFRYCDGIREPTYNSKFFVRLPVSYKGEYVIPETIETICGYAFEGCHDLTSITIPESVTSIGDGAFYQCFIPTYIPGYGSIYRATSIIINGKINSIGENAFYNVYPKYVEINNNMTVVPNWNLSNMSEVKIGDKVTTLYNGLFSRCNALKKVILGKNLQYIRNDNFSRCSALDSVICYSEEPPYCYPGVFDGTDLSKSTLVVSKRSIDKYKETAPWSEFGTISARQSFTLTYVVNGEVYKTEDYEQGESIEPDMPEREGYSFSGWEGLPESMPSENITVTGTFTVNQYWVTYEVDGKNYTSEKLDYGSTVTPPAMQEKEGCDFVWEDYPENVPASDITIKGRYVPRTYILTYVLDGVEYKTIEVTYGSDIQPEEIAEREGYTFSGWEGLPNTMPAENVTVTGTFTINRYTLTYILNGEVYKTEEVEYGSNITPEMPEMEGYIFSGWEGLPDTMPAGDVTVTATLVANSFILTYLIDGEEYKTYTLTFGADITPENAPEREGYTFSGWDGLPGTMPAGNVTVTGHYTVNEYWVTFMVDGKPYTSEKIAYGSVIVPPEVPEKEGFEFEWSYIPDTMPAKDIMVYGSYTTGIAEIMADQNVAGIYSIDGKRLSRPQRGLNIIRMKDGTVKRVMVK